MTQVRGPDSPYIQDFSARVSKVLNHYETIDKININGIVVHMKIIHIPEKVMWVVLVIGAIAGAVMIGWQTHKDWKSLPEAERQPVISASAATTEAAKFTTDHFGTDLSSYTHTAILAMAPIPDTFLSQSYLEDEAQTKYRDTYLSAPLIYDVRFFKPEQIEEYEVTLDAYRRDVQTFAQVLPEDTVITDVSEDTAVEAARAYVARVAHVDASKLALHHKEEKKLPGGTVRTITLAWQGSEVDSKYGKGFVTFVLDLRGETVTSFGKSFEYPEPYEREITKSVTMGGIVGLGSMLAWVIMLVAALVVTIRFFIAHIAQWKPALVVTIALSILTTIDFANNYAALLSGYSTVDSMTMYTITALIGLAFAVILTGLMFILPATAGYTLAVSTYRDRIAPLMTLPTTAESRRSYRASILRGYLLGIMFLGFTFALYWVGKAYCGVWSPVNDPMETIGLNSIVPAFTMIVTLGIGAAVTEEVTFRLFGILWLRRITKSTFLAVLFATAVWAFAHTDGSTLPVWFRGVEVFAGGLLFAYFFIRYNILTTMTAHYVHNILLACSLLYFTFGKGQIIPMILIFAMPAIVYAIIELVVAKRGV